MKISHNFPDLERDSALLIVCGKQTGKLYTLRDGEIKETDTVHIETPHYSDREGFFMRRGGGMTFGSGAAYENQKEYIQHQFVKELALHLRAFTKDVQHVYLFAPAYEAPLIKAVIPPQLRRRITQECHGNYVRHRPQELLKMLEKHWEKVRAQHAEHQPTGEAAKLWYRRADGLA